mgnify:CR=1 FL=1
MKAMREKIEEQKTWGLMLVLMGLCLYCLIEFALGTMMVVPGTILLCLAERNRKRLAFFSANRRWGRAGGAARHGAPQRG